MAKKQTAPKITAVKKGDIYENKQYDLIEVTNGRLKDEPGLGSSFEGRLITFNMATGLANRSKTTDRFYLDELVKKLSKADYDEWVEAGRREAEAMTDPAGDQCSEIGAAEPHEAATESESTPSEPSEPVPEKPKSPQKPKSKGKLSQLDAAVKVLRETGAPMNTKAMIELMAAKGYWTSPSGATPSQTLYSAILRELQKKWAEARFTKVERGQFTLAGQ
jgi:hypothetical protein